MKIDIILNMRLLMAMIPLLPMAALAVTVEPLPQSEFADTEVSTNIAFVVERPAMTRIEFTVALDATPTNNVEVAIGTDTNGDGNLAVEEAANVFGYDCGRWFKREGELFDCSDWSIVRIVTQPRDFRSFFNWSDWSIGKRRGTRSVRIRVIRGQKTARRATRRNMTDPSRVDGSGAPENVSWSEPAVRRTYQKPVPAGTFRS